MLFSYLFWIIYYTVFSFFFIYVLLESKGAGEGYLPSVLLYFSGSCGTIETQLEIAEAFLEVFLSSNFGGSCTEGDECTVNNVQVTCGPSGRRRRKRRRRRRQMDIPVDFGIGEKLLPFRHPFSKIHKRSALDFECVNSLSLLITFKIIFWRVSMAFLNKVLFCYFMYEKI